MTSDEWPPLTLRERIGFAFDRIYHWFEWRIRGIRCWLTRHDIAWGDYHTGEPAYCKRCWRQEPYEEYGLWYVLNHWYAFWVEHSKLFENFDDRLCTSKLQRWLPSWWEY